ncbi:hypothetical protein NDU88_001939 [Pleurodeles waltl]|uniref:Secreted protein n=1 Tax=Pleurodeles waltl TaxID=8319 RepID=A0AAV7W1I4_PLEWA|nr:hypothetical protein NDU88_001939 [Pleurodeles waltl]
MPGLCRSELCTTRRARAWALSMVCSAGRRPVAGAAQSSCSGGALSPSPEQGRRVGPTAAEALTESVHRRSLAPHREHGRLPAAYAGHAGKSPLEGPIKCTLQLSPPRCH